MDNMRTTPAVTALSKVKSINTKIAYTSKSKGLKKALAELDSYVKNLTYDEGPSNE